MQPKTINRRFWLQAASITAVTVASTGLVVKSASRTRKRVAITPHNQAPPELAPSELRAQAPDTTPEEPTPSPPVIEHEHSHPIPKPPRTYEEFLASFHFRHIRPAEVLRPHDNSIRGTQNSLPPRELWQYMPASLLVADEIRHRLGRPLNFITSAYRNPLYNKKCGGASRSWHTRNCALDLVYESGPRAAYQVAHQLRDEGFFQGGIGLYSTFIHIDTRGYNANWRG
ncbi:MAG: D-Ala-D-Ala carboxypeptidase family metallohydrolase [Verrucomicrobiota bacterium]